MFSNVSANVTAAIFKNNAVGIFWLVVGNELKETLQTFQILYDILPKAEDTY
jgi:hypothetical protein